MKERPITSLSHPIAKHLVKLRESSHYRHSEATMFITGEKLLQALPDHWPVRRLLLAKEVPPPPAQLLRAEEHIHTDLNWLRKVTGQQSPEGWAAEVALPSIEFPSQIRRLLVLDGISDPGNLGTLQRTALAFGWEGIYLLPGCCDPYNHKVLRSAMGATFHLPIKSGVWEDLEERVVKSNLQVLAADAGGKPVEGSLFDSRLALILGSESQGLSVNARQKAKIIGLPIGEGVESLNVAVAGGILLYLLR